VWWGLPSPGAVLKRLGKDERMDESAMLAEIEADRSQEGPKKAMVMDIPNMVKLTARMPDSKEIPGLKGRMKGYIEELEAEPGIERTRTIIEEMRKIPHIEDAVNALDAFINGRPKLVAQIARSVILYWGEFSSTQGHGEAKQDISSAGQLEQRRSGDEQAAWDLINSQD
jgi:hypothetical protein